MRCYLDGLTCFPNTPIVYIDETGIDTYLYRHKAGATLGEKGDDKVSGRRFERISVVAGQIGSQIVAPLLYHRTMKMVSRTPIAIFNGTPSHYYG